MKYSLKFVITDICTCNHAIAEARLGPSVVPQNVVFPHNDNVGRSLHKRNSFNLKSGELCHTNHQVYRAKVERGNGSQKCS